MKTRLLTLLLLCLYVSLSAGKIKSYLVVWAKDGTKVAYALVEKPKLTFTETDLVVMTNGVEVNFPMDNLSRFTYETTDITAIRSLETDEMLFKLDGEFLLFPDLSGNSIVSLYSLNGTLVFNKSVLIAGEYSFPLSSMKAGVYMVTVNGLTYKIVKR